MTSKQRNKNRGQCEKRLRSELLQMQTNPPPLCSACLKNDDLYEWKAAIEGPPESPYEGGKFVLDLKFTPQYPFSPPKVKFVTKIYHCNISNRGEICVDLLDVNWTPAMTVSSLMLSICSLLTDANPNSPLNHTAAQLYTMNRTLHDVNAKIYTEKYAK
ncbi:hypothetical protein JTE90_016614 [Oedothorax gibbosus]|uniref:E2 ubiquitin-conjugating enzyme n=1 Tax=Oedothorax gibbosus TaxID=931172 RepID=A0AAV6UWX1_9ARAC|nr:hypothetical protein JTE90_016614 [Oedothorax gibbosus]